jgi:hypothetical protein
VKPTAGDLVVCGVKIIQTSDKIWHDSTHREVRQTEAQVIASPGDLFVCAEDSVEVLRDDTEETTSSLLYLSLYRKTGELIELTVDTDTATRDLLITWDEEGACFMLTSETRTVLIDG